MRKDLHEANRRSWNAATRAHNSHKLDQANFLREGGSTLYEEELELLGDLDGRRLLHLQCNAGQDSLSLAARGAQVIGVDIADEAIAFACALRNELGSTAEFERADVYDWLEAAAAAGRRFDIVFCSYGWMCWLSDLERWAALMFRVLEPGGRFVTVEFHPMGLIFDEDWKLRYDYRSHGEPLAFEEGVTDYVALSGDGLWPGRWDEGQVDFKNPHPSHEFNWGIADLLDALATAGLTLERMREYPYATGWKAFKDMRRGEGRKFFPPRGFPEIALMFGLSAWRPPR